MMKSKSKTVILTALAAAVLILLCACGTAGTPADGKLRVIATVFPEYDWIRNIAGDRADRIDLILLLDSGADMHSFRPTAADIAAVASCDLFICIGGESDDWVDDVLAGAGNGNMKTVRLLEILGDRALEEERLEGMQTGEETGEEKELDEHVWLSLKNAAVLCRELAKVLGDADPEGKEIYEANAAEYIGKLEDLDARYATAVAEAPKKALVFGDRFPFVYLAKDYGIECYAAFSGCSAECEASFETVVFLAGKLDELDLPAVLKIDGSDGKIAERVRQTSNNPERKILALDSLQTAASEDVRKGVTYLSVMENNLEVLKAALGS